MQRRLDRRQLPVAALLLTVALGVGVLLVSGDAYLGTDTGGKVATLEAMTERGDWSLDVGYWAEDWDPDGSYHPQFGTKPTETGWVQVTTIPMILVARPLYDVGGYRLALAVPILGTVAAALAGAALARRIGHDRSRVPTLVAIGLASPLAVYALDLWEHSWGVACGAWAAVLMFDVAAGRRHVLVGAGAGALLGVGAVMRQELLIYALTIVAAACLALVVARRKLVPALVAGTSSVVGLAGAWVLNAWLEGVFSANERTDRAADTAVATVTEGGGVGGSRLGEGLRTTFAMSAANERVAIVLGIVFVVLVALVARYATRIPRGRMPLVAVALSLPFLAVVVTGLGFVPGLFAAFPVASAALAFRAGARASVVTVVALVSLPIVWLFQYLGGAGPQWGGRYLLVSTFLLGVVGVVTLYRPEVPPIIRNVVFAVSLGVTLWGVAWLVHRSHEVDRFFDQVMAVQEDALIGRNQFFLREVGPRALDERWLSAPRNGALAGPVEVLDDAGVDRFSVLQRESDPIPRLRGVEGAGVDAFDLFGRTFVVLHYQFDG